MKDPTIPAHVKTFSPGDESGLLGRASGYAPQTEETEQRVRRIQTKQVVVFWVGTAVGLSVAAYAYHAAKYKFESKKVAGYLKNGTDLVYSLGYFMEKAHQTSFGAGVPHDVATGRPRAPRPPVPMPSHRSDEMPYVPVPMPMMPFPIGDAAPRAAPDFDIFQYGGNPDASGIINGSVQLP